MAVSYGHVAIVPKGIWSAETQYEACNLVEHDGSSYVAKARPPIGTLPTDTAYWQVSAAGTKKATVDSLGTVMPDGTTTEVNTEGKISVKTAQQDSAGMVKGSDDVNVGEDGALTINTAFEQATELANLIAGEAIKEVLGKVSKAIATTMNLDQNALLKNMVSGIDANDSNKIPSSAFVHTLYERLGMGTDLSAGDATNVTQAVNSLYSNIEMLGTRVLFENNPPYKIGNNLSEIIEKLDGWSIDMRANTFYVGIIFIGVAGYSLSGGSWNIIGCKTSNAYEWQMAIKYSENTGITVTARSKINNIWNSWGNIT